MGTMDKIDMAHNYGNRKNSGTFLIRCRTMRIMKIPNTLEAWVVSFFLGAVFLGWLLVRDPISQSKWDLVKVGMTKSAVIKIMGKPDSLDGNQLEYARWFNAGWVEFSFDTNDVLIGKNDESAFVSLSK